MVSDMDQDNIGLYNCSGGLTQRKAEMSFSDEDFFYEVWYGEAVITGYIGPGGDVEIPLEAAGYPVVEIAPWAFAENNTITSLIITPNVKIIGESAFFGCVYLASVTFLYSAAEIRANAFACCYSLTDIDFGDRLRSIGDYAFRITSLVTVVIPESVTFTGRYVFDGCDSLTSVYVYSEFINYEIFWGRHSLTRIHIGGRVRNISGGYFTDCQNLVYLR